MRPSRCKGLVSRIKHRLRPGRKIWIRIKCQFTRLYSFDPFEAILVENDEGTRWTRLSMSIHRILTFSPWMNVCFTEIALAIIVILGRWSKIKSRIRQLQIVGLIARRKASFNPTVVALALMRLCGHFLAKDASLWYEVSIVIFIKWWQGRVRWLSEFTGCLVW